MEIEIKGKDEILVNETQSIGILNINQILSKLEMRIGTKVLFYFTDLYF